VFHLLFLCPQNRNDHPNTLVEISQHSSTLTIRDAHRWASVILGIIFAPSSHVTTAPAPPQPDPPQGVRMMNQRGCAPVWIARVSWQIWRAAEQATVPLDH
jgi:hypothetical protein